MSAYHSALCAEERAAPRREWRGPAGVALVHDLEQPLPDVFAECDVFYADPPWSPGYREFLRRAGVSGGVGWADFMRRMAQIADSFSVPVVLVAGKEAARYFVDATQAPIALNDKGAVAYYWRMVPVPAATTMALLVHLAQRFRCVGDFCCGYGRAGRVFASYGKRFVLSDVNPHCIGHIAAKAGGW